MEADGFAGLNASVVMAKGGVGARVTAPRDGEWMATAAAAAAGVGSEDTGSFAGPKKKVKGAFPWQILLLRFLSTALSSLV